MRTIVPVGFKIWTASSVKRTEYLASQIGPIPTRFSWNPGMTCPEVGKSEGRLGRANVHDADEVVGGPVAAPTVMAGALGFRFAMGALGVRKMLLAPESIRAVVRSLRRMRRRAAYLR